MAETRVQHKRKNTSAKSRNSEAQGRGGSRQAHRRNAAAVEKGLRDVMFLKAVFCWIGKT